MKFFYVTVKTFLNIQFFVLMLLHAFDFLYFGYNRKTHLEKILVHSYEFLKTMIGFCCVQNLNKHFGIQKVLKSSIFLTSFIIFANITAGSKLLYAPVGWEGWLFIAACSNLILNLLHQRTLSFVGGLEGCHILIFR